MSGRTLVIDTVHVDDLQWLADTGESLDRIAARVGAKPKSIEKLLREQGHLALLARIQANAPADLRVQERAR